MNPAQSIEHAVVIGASGGIGRAFVEALAALGRWPQLRSHIGGALHVGATKQEVTEVLLQMQNYCGWPVTLTGLEIADEVFREFDASSEQEAKAE